MLSYVLFGIKALYMRENSQPPCDGFRTLKKEVIMDFFLLTWSAKEWYDQEWHYIWSRDTYVKSGQKRHLENAEAQVCRVDLLPNDKKNTGLRISQKGEEVKFDIEVEEFDLLNELSYNGEFLVEVNTDGNVVSVYDTHRPPKIVEEGPKGQKVIKTAPHTSPHHPVGCAPAYDKWGGKLDGYERSESPEAVKLYELIEDLVNS